MKPSYTSIPLLPGTHQPGIVRVQVAPIQFVQTTFSPNFISGVVEQAIQLKAGKAFTEFQFIQPSYLFESKPKEGKSGDFYNITVSGILNNVIPNIINVLETARYDELIVVTTDMRRRKRIIGNDEFGMKLSYAEKNSNATNGSQSIQVDMLLDAEAPPPFYIDDASTVGDLNGIYSNVLSPSPASEFVPFNLTGDTVIEWTATRKNKFGSFPIIQVWSQEGNNYYLASIPVDAVGNPVTQFIVRNNGGNGYIKIS